MNQLLGFVTAFFVVGWAVRWYFRQHNPLPQVEIQPPKDDQVLPSATKWETLNEVALLEPFTEPRISAAPPPRRLDSPVSGKVEQRLEALVTDDPPTTPTPPAIIEAIEATATPVDVIDEEVEESNDEGEPTTETVIGFCARCRDKREVLNPTRAQTKKGKSAIRGTCSVCGAGMFVFVAENK